MSIINREVADFSVQAYVNGEFKTVTKADIPGKCGHEEPVQRHERSLYGDQ